MLIDSFIFGGEIDMLEFRMKLLWDHVDKFVIVEADKSHSGKPKAFHFSTYKPDFSWAADKIVYMPIEVDVFDLNLDAPRPSEFDFEHYSWKIENRQRSAIIDACKYFSDSDILMLSDADEIPSHMAMEFRKKNNLVYPMACDQMIIPYSLNYHRPDIGWRGTVMCDLGYARSVGTQALRNMRQEFSPLPGGGWHLTYFGGVDQVKLKIQSYAHQENNREEFIDEGKIHSAILSGGSLFNESSNNIRIDPHTFFPSYFLEHAPRKWMEK